MLRLRVQGYSSWHEENQHETLDHCTDLGNYRACTITCCGSIAARSCLKPVSVGLTFWVQMVWMIPFFLSFSERKRGNNSSGTTGMLLLWLLTITGLAGAVAAYKYFVWSG